MFEIFLLFLLLTGTPLKDTVCEPCRNRRSEDEMWNVECDSHTECKSDERLLIRGTSYMDNVCVSCSSIARDGMLY